MFSVACLLGGLALLGGIMSCSDSEDEEAIYASQTDDFANVKNHASAKGYASSNLRNGKTEPVSVSNLNDGSTSVQSYIIANTTDATNPDVNPWFAVDLGEVRVINKVRVVPGAGQDAANGDTSTAEGLYPNAYPTKYSVQVSEDDAVSDPSEIPSLTWKTVAVVNDGVYATKNVSFWNTKARWVRILVDEFNDKYCSLLELSVFGPRPSVDYSDLGKEINVLFIGNSLTYYNNMWSVFEGISLLKGYNVHATAVTFGGKNLIFHSNAPNTESAIKAKKFDYIVLQDICGSFTDDKLTRGSQAIIAKIRESNPDAKLVYYATWPKKTDQDARTAEFTLCYINKAQQYGALVSPAGEAFYDLTKTNEKFYYEDDGTHPQPVGSFLSASTFFYTIFADEKPGDISSSRHDELNKLINSYVSDSSLGKETSYDLGLLSQIDKLAYKYASAVRPAAADSTGATKYQSVANPDAVYEDFVSDE